MTRKFRLIFLPATDYKILGESINSGSKSTYNALVMQGIENLIVGESNVVFIPDKYRDTLSDKAEKGEQIG